MAKRKLKQQPVAAIAVRADVKGDTALSLVERFARDPHFDVQKMQALLDMRDREMARIAENEFNQALNRAQRLMRPISADAENKQTSSRYATYRRLDAAMRPIYTGEGFGISFDTDDSPKGVDHVRVICYVSHQGGYSRTYRVDMPADGKGAKGGDVMTKTHAAGAAMSYGMRYLLKMIFNIAVGEADRDGNDVSIDVQPVVVHDAEPVRGPAPGQINAAEQKRLWQVVERTGRDINEVKLWLRKRYGYKSSAEVERKDYAAICAALEGRGALSMPGDGE